jgi:hypothetical protein
MRGGFFAAFVLVGTAGPVLAQSNGPLNSITLPRAPVASIEVRTALPAWVAMPPSARILTSDGLEMRPLRNSAVTYENARMGVLVGALVNAAGCARNLRAFLQYTDRQWRPIGEPIESEARVSQVEPGGPLPYRFRLKRTDDFEVAPAGYILQVVEDGKKVADTLQWVTTTRQSNRPPCAPQRIAIDAVVTHSRANMRGYRISGTLTVTAGGPVRPDALTVTALLRDAGGDVLEVLTGVPAVNERQLPAGVIESGQSLAFSLSTDIPLGKAVATTTVFTEVLGEPQSSAVP